MFTSIVILTLGCVAIITVRDWVTSRMYSKSGKKELNTISQLISLQDWEKAEKELRHLFNRGKAGKEAYLCEIQILRSKGLLQEALFAAEMKSRLFPEELLFRLEEGKILLDLDKPKEALQAFQICTPILRKESDLFALASALCQAGYPQECLDVLAPFLKKPQNGYIAALAGDALYELKYFPDAITRFTQALELGCKTHRVFVQLGHAYRRFGSLGQAETIFRELLGRDPTDLEAALGLGACLQERGQHHKALLIYQTGLTVHAQELRLLRQAAFAALCSKKYRFAERYFFELQQLQTADAQTLAYYGLSLESQKKWQEAEQTYLKLTQLFPAYYQGYRALAWMFGVGLSQTVSHTLGMHFAHRALKLKNDPLSWEILSACAARTGQFDKAYQIQLALSKQDNDPQTRTRRQQALRTLRKKTPLGDSQVLRTQVA